MSAIDLHDPLLRGAERALVSHGRLGSSLLEVPDALGRHDDAEALAHVQAAKAEASALWAELDELERQLEAQRQLAVVVRDVEGLMARGGGL